MHAKLRFSYGTMSSGKSLQVLTTAHNFEQRNIHFLIFKSDIDTRDGASTIKSRIGNGIERECIPVSPEFNIYEYVKEYILNQYSATRTIEPLQYSRGVDGFTAPICFIGQTLDIMSNGQTEIPSGLNKSEMVNGYLVLDAQQKEFIYSSGSWYEIGQTNLELEEKELKWILVDEAQFLTEEQVDQLGDIVDYLGIDVYCFGLRTDFKTHLFPGSKRLFEIADKLEEIKSTCECGRKNLVNARFTKDGKLAVAGAQTQVGGDSMYTAICRRCYKEKMREQEQNKEEKEN